MHIHHALRTVSTSLLLAALVTGCSSTATISRLHGQDVEAKIVGSDNENLYLETRGAWASSGIARRDVTDIDHPGNVGALIGGVITTYGAVNILTGARHCGDQGAAFCMGVFLPAAIGLPIMISGLSRWSASTSAADPKSGKPTASISVLPVASLQKKNEFVGASLSITY